MFRCKCYGDEKTDLGRERGRGSSYSQKPEAKLTNSDCKLVLLPNPVFFSCSFCAFKVFSGSFLFAVHDVIRICHGLIHNLGSGVGGGTAGRKRTRRGAGGPVRVRSGGGGASGLWWMVGS